MDAPQNTIERALRRLLPVCDAAAERRDAVDAALEKGDRKDVQAARTAHRRAVRRAHGAIERSLQAGTLAPLLPPTVVRPAEAFVALRLLSSRVTEGADGLAGRTLLAQLYQSPVDVLKGARLLDADAPLRRSGIVVGTDHEDPLEREYRFGDARYADACRLLGGMSNPAVMPYADAAEHLADWHRLAVLYRRRATLLFGEDLMEALTTFGPETVADANHALDVQRERMVARLMATPHRQGIATLAFQRRHGLGELEMVLVATLLYHPVLAGVAATPVALAAKVIAAREADLLATASLLGPRAPLRRHGLVQFDDPALDDAEGLGAVTLTPSAEAELLGDQRRSPGIGTGEQSAFRRYLDSLDGSDSFFRNLGLGGPTGPAPGREETPPAA